MNDRYCPEPSERAPTESFADWVRTWRYFFWPLGLAVLVFLAYRVENWRGHRDWERYRQQMIARGEPIDRSLLVPPPVPDEENFAMTPFLAPVFDFVPGTQQPRDAHALARVQAFAKRYDAANPGKGTNTLRSNSWTGPRTDLAAWYAAFQPSTNAAIQHGKPVASAPVAPVEMAPGAPPASGVLAALSECDPVFEELRSASRRPFSRFNLDYGQEPPSGILLPHLSLLKHLCQVLQLRASAELALEQSEDALNDITLMLRLADASRSEPVLISHLVRFGQLHLAMRPIAEGLAAHQWSEDQLRRLEERLRGFDCLADGRRMLQGESVLLGEGMIEYIRRHPLQLNRMMESPSDQPGSGAVLPFFACVAPGGWYDLEKLSLSRMSQENLLSAIELSRRRVTPKAAYDGDERLAAALSRSRPALFFRHRFFASNFLPNLTNVSYRVAFMQTGLDLAGLACALERYRLASGHFPDQLELLVPRFIPRIPTDVINGGPLKYRLAPGDTFVLYSVGWNESDEGGALGLTSHEGNVDPNQGDWVWRGP